MNKWKIWNVVRDGDIQYFATTDIGHKMGPISDRGIAMELVDLLNDTRMYYEDSE